MIPILVILMCLIALPLNSSEKPFRALALMIVILAALSILLNDASE